MRALLAIQRSGSFARAAQDLAMSQPSLSKAVARLEDQLGVRLFDRTAAGSRLTPIGELITERAAKVVAESEQIVRDAALVAGGEAGQICIGVGTAMRPHFLPRFVVRLAEHYPQLVLRIEVLEQERLVPLLNDRTFDLIICAMGPNISGDLVATLVLETHGVAVAHPDHPLARQNRVTVEEFVRHTGAGASLREYSNARLFGQPDSAPVARYTSNDYDSMVDLALAGHATLVAPLFIAEPYLAEGRLTRINLDWNVKVSFAAIATRATSYSPMVGRIIGHAIAVGETLTRRPAATPLRHEV